MKNMLCAVCNQGKSQIKKASYLLSIVRIDQRKTTSFAITTAITASFDLLSSRIVKKESRIEEIDEFKICWWSDVDEKTDSSSMIGGCGEICVANSGG